MDTQSSRHVHGRTYTQKDIEKQTAIYVLLDTQTRNGWTGSKTTYIHTKMETKRDRGIRTGMHTGQADRQTNGQNIDQKDKRRHTDWGKQPDRQKMQH